MTGALRLIPITLIALFVMSTILLGISISLGWIAIAEVAVVSSLLFATLIALSVLVSSGVYAWSGRNEYWIGIYPVMLALMFFGLAIWKSPVGLESLLFVLAGLWGGYSVATIARPGLDRYIPLTLVLVVLLLDEYVSGHGQSMMLSLSAGIVVSRTTYHRRLASPS